MFKNLYVLLLLALLLGCGAAKLPSPGAIMPIKAQIDLVEVLDDKVMVVVDPGQIGKDEILFLIPRIIPGTYSEDNFGAYVQDFVALDYDAEPMNISRKDVNSWLISDAKKLDKVTYYVNDTFDTELEVEEAVFSPAGTNIAAGENFLLNLHGFVGYFEGLKEVPYELNIVSPSELKPATSLHEISAEITDKGQYNFSAKRYFELVDNPILFARANTETFKISDISVTLSVYSPTGRYSAKDFRPQMEAMIKAQKAFLGGVSGTKTYTILLYLAQISDSDATGYGALEHHTSTVVVLPEALPKQVLDESMVDIVSHEFFHTLTPLSVHSREIQFFNFNEPDMSMHLWMYEGTTEYFANFFQVQEGLIEIEEFYDRMAKKISNSRVYDDSMSFTTMSERILESPFKENYLNVYEKGALINMCLDILLREQSNGEKGVLWLMKELSAIYNEDTPFDDPELIGEIVAMTYPEIGSFFEKHVQGKEPIPYPIYLEKVGLKLEMDQKPASYFFLGQIPYIDADPGDLDTIFVQKGMELNSFFQDLGAKGGDIIIKINDTTITLDSMRTIVGESFGWDAEKDIRMTVMRDGELIDLQGKAGTPIYTERKIVEMDSVSEKVISLRRAWLGQ
ncbi:peptidase M61 [Muriicola sp. E247]|uniref:M61 family metallopeptidase n=1 Tax=Muriicola sp. E247 TaxID=3242730 RepID=UPI0035266063